MFESQEAIAGRQQLKASPSQWGKLGDLDDGQNSGVNQDARGDGRKSATQRIQNGRGIPVEPPPSGQHSGRLRLLPSTDPPLFATRPAIPRPLFPENLRMQRSSRRFSRTGHIDHNRRPLLYLRFETASLRIVLDEILLRFAYFTGSGIELAVVASELPSVAPAHLLSEDQQKGRPPRRTSLSRSTRGPQPARTSTAPACRRTEQHEPEEAATTT